MAKIVIVCHSESGTTRLQAEHVFKGVQSVNGTSPHLLSTEEAINNFELLDQADCIIFGCPTYMGGTTASFKKFIDMTGKHWASQAWKDKLAAGFTNSQGPSGDKLMTLTQLLVNAMQHGMIWISTGFIPGAEGTAGTDRELNRLSSFLGAMAQSPEGADKPLPADLYTAEIFGRRVAQATLRWIRGKQ